MGTAGGFLWETMGVSANWALGISRGIKITGLPSTLDAYCRCLLLHMMQAEKEYIDDER